jgi:hypothetical protein
MRKHRSRPIYNTKGYNKLIDYIYINCPDETKSTFNYILQQYFTNQLLDFFPELLNNAILEAIGIIPKREPEFTSTTVSQPSQATYTVHSRKRIGKQQQSTRSLSRPRRQAR